MAETIAQMNARLNAERIAREAAGGAYARTQQLAEQARQQRAAQQAQQS